MVTRFGLCAQKVCLHCASRLGIDESLAVGMASAFGTGLGHAETCGCICGAHMVLGLRYGRAATLDEGRLKKPLLVEKVSEFERRLSQKQPCRLCRDILGMDITQPGVMKQAADKGLFATVCADMLKDTCAVLDGMLDEDDEAEARS
ncbi:C-GCAxxG-C-C family protein [uncultured Mailhella sp.]|uniref:C-GCAxxG-C-C family protein n=1 Tax=uncultured Mailhella sp. TaxID=1981031 RepID=UPI0025E56575|nr:C-GCAxxG-C-C family protein [uncultured Mailhella sp.]